jgi:hypothetical protein
MASLDVRCPSCHETALKAVRGGIVGAVLRMFALQTFRCQICGHRFQAEWTGSSVRPDRREYARLPVQLTASITTRGGTADAKLLDLSLGGCLVDQCALPMPPGTTCRLHIFLPGKPLDIDLARVRSTGQHTHLQFVRLGRAHRIRLGVYVLSLWRARAFSRSGRKASTLHTRASA